MIISCAAALRAQEPPGTGTPGFSSCTAIHRQSRSRVAGLTPSGCREPWPHARNGWSPPSPSPTAFDANVRHGQIEPCILYGERPCVSSPFRPTRTVTSSDGQFYPRCLVPECRGVNYGTLNRFALWDNYYTAAPGRLRPSAEPYNAAPTALPPSLSVSSESENRRQMEKACVYVRCPNGTEATPVDGAHS
jgi:hypothetical protein